MAGAQYHLQGAVQAVTPHINDALGRVEHFLAPYISEARSFANGHAAPAFEAIQPKLQHIQARLQNAFQHSTASIDSCLNGLQPWQIAAVTAVSVLITMWVMSWLLAMYAELRETGRDIVTPISNHM